MKRFAAHWRFNSLHFLQFHHLESCIFLELSITFIQGMLFVTILDGEVCLGPVYQYTGETLLAIFSLSFFSLGTIQEMSWAGVFR